MFFSKFPGYWKVFSVACFSGKKEKQPIIVIMKRQGGKKFSIGVSFDMLLTNLCLDLNKLLLAKRFIIGNYSVW